MSLEELRALLKAGCFESCDVDHSCGIGRSELRQALSCELGRALTEAELARLWDSIDTNADGTLDPHEWRQAGGHFEADSVAGLARALFREVLRILPRTPAMRFFKPKDRRFHQPSPAGEAPTPLATRAAGKLSLMAVSAGASMLLFKSHSWCTAQAAMRDGCVGTEVADAEGGPPPRAREVAGHFAGGALGGVLHACFVHPFTSLPPAGAPRWALGPRLAGLRGAALKDALGFSVFFGAHAEAQRALEPSVGDATSHLRAMAASVAAGGLAGSCYHMVSYPFGRALEFAHPDTHVRALCAAARDHGVVELYRGVLRSAAPGVCTGALTFGLYDAVLRYAV